MAVSYDMHALNPSRALPSSPASELKNAFKGVFQQALQTGAVGITRNRKREAVLLSAELYDQMIAALAENDPLKTLRNDYEARFAAAQNDMGRSAYQAAFDASPEALGRTAAEQA